MPTPYQATLIATELAALLDTAKALQSAGMASHGRSLLRNKNIGLLSEHPDGAAATRFIDAAQELGAQVSLIRPQHAGLFCPSTTLATTRMLGRLYDAIECQDLPPELLRQLQLQCGTPVLDSQSSLATCPPDWVDKLPVTEQAARERLLVQALLMRALSS